MPTKIANLGAVVLCGGQSRRLGMPKSELELGEATFLQIITRTVASICSKVVVVGEVGRDQELPNDVVRLRDEQDDSGPLEGMRVGLRALSSDFDYAFVTSCDAPLLKLELIETLYSAIHSFQAVFPVEVLENRNRIYGLTAIYRTDVHSAIAQRIAKKRLRVSELAEAFDAKLISVEDLRMVDANLDSLTNINTPSDYALLLERLGQACSPMIKARLRFD